MFGIEAALEGRIARDPELKMVKGGTMAMLSMSLAVDEPVKTGEDAKTTWINAKMFGDKAKAASERLAQVQVRLLVRGQTLRLHLWRGRFEHGQGSVPATSTRHQHQSAEKAAAAIRP